MSQINAEIIQNNIVVTVNWIALSGGGGAGTGDVVGPATNDDSYIPQWNGNNSKTLKNGLPVPAGGLAGLTALGTKLTANAPITGATKTKITYDANGLVTAGADATTADIADSLNKRYVTDANLTTIGNQSGTNTGDETVTTIKTKLGAAATGADGYLTSTDWNTFNGKQSALGFTPENVVNKSTSVSTDGSSDTKYPSVKAVKDYADALVAGLLDYRGGYDASGNTWPATGGSGTAGAVMKGDMWVISVQGTLGGNIVHGGDSIAANIDTPGQTSGNWNTFNTNLAYVPEDAANKVTSISGASTDTQYPSAKLLYDQLAGKQAVGTYSTDIHSNITALNAVSGINTGDQDLSVLVPKSLYDAHTILYATTDNTPAALTVGQQTLVGRVTGGNIAAIAIDSDLTTVSASHDTIPSALATKNYADLKAPLDSPTFTGTVSGITAAMVGAPSGSGTCSGTNTGDQTLSGLGGVPTSRTITINGTAQDLSANRSWTISTAVEGTAVLSTGETGGTKYLREDGDGTCSWQPVSGSSTTNNLWYQVRGATVSAIAVTDMVNGLVHDGITYATGDKILNKNATDPAENGPYTIGASGTGTRCTDANSDATIRGSKVLVQEGTVNACFVYVQCSPGAITVDTDDINYTRVMTETITSNMTLTVDPAGSGIFPSFTSTIAAFAWLNNYLISGNAIVTIQGVDAIEDSSTGGLMANHPNWQQIYWNGVASVEKTVISVQSSSGSSRNYSYILNLSDVTGITTKHYFYWRVPSLTGGPSGGTLPEYLVGIYEITNVDSVNNRITIKSYQYDSNLASGNVTGTCNIIKTVYRITAASKTALTISSGLGQLKDIAIVYNTPATPSGTGISFLSGKLLSCNTVGVHSFNIGVLVNPGYFNSAGNACSVNNCNRGYLLQGGASGSLNQCSAIGNVNNSYFGCGIKYGCSVFLNNFVACGNNSTGLYLEKGVVTDMLGGRYGGNNGYGIHANIISGGETSNTTYAFRNVTNDIYTYGNSTIKNAAVFTISGAVTNGDATVTSSDTSRLYVGSRISGTNIPDGTTVASITNSTTFEMSNTATPGSGTVTITVKPRVSPAVNTVSSDESIILE